MQSSITVIVPAYNEEANLESTVKDLVPLLDQEFKDYEILVFDDCSKDRTPEIADALAKAYPKVRVVHNEVNRNLGWNYKKGVELATKDFVIMIPGDNEITGDSFRGMFRLLGQADIVIPHTMNMEIRPRGRQVLSRAYTALMNLLFGLRIQYYNGTVIHKREAIQSVKIETDSFAYQAEALIKLIRKGRTYVETGMWLKERAGGESKALRLKNVYRVGRAIAELFWQIRVRGILD